MINSVCSLKGYNNRYRDQVIFDERILLNSLTKHNDRVFIRGGEAQLLVCPTLISGLTVKCDFKT